MTKTTCIGLLSVFLLSSCGVQMICPAYQSAFVLDDDYQRDLYSLFTVVDGDTEPKRPYGYKFKVDDGDSLMEKFIAGTPGKGFRIQRGRVHPLEKAGFKYENRSQPNLFAKIFTGPEKPVLENPYLFDRITKKRPFYKLDHLEMDLVHFNAARHDSLVKKKVNQDDTARYDALMQEYYAKPTAIQAQHVPLLRAGFNTEQEEYNKKYRDYFLAMPDPPEPIDSTELELNQGDTTAADTTKTGFFGRLFKKKKKEDNEEEAPRERKRDRNNDEGIKEEEDEEWP